MWKRTYRRKRLNQDLLICRNGGSTNQINFRLICCLLVRTSLTCVGNSGKYIPHARIRDISNTELLYEVSSKKSSLETSFKEVPRCFLIAGWQQTSRMPMDALLKPTTTIDLIEQQTEQKSWDCIQRQQSSLIKQFQALKENLKQMGDQSKH